MRSGSWATSRKAFHSNAIGPSGRSEIRCQKQVAGRSLQPALEAFGYAVNALAKLPEAKRQEWHKLWDDVEALRKRAAEKK